MKRKISFMTAELKLRIFANPWRVSFMLFDKMLFKTGDRAARMALWHFKDCPSLHFSSKSTKSSFSNILWTSSETGESWVLSWVGAVKMVAGDSIGVMMIWIQNTYNIYVKCRNMFLPCIQLSNFHQQQSQQTFWRAFREPAVSFHGFHPSWSSHWFCFVCPVDSFPFDRQSSTWIWCWTSLKVNLRDTISSSDAVEASGHDLLGRISNAWGRKTNLFIFLLCKYAQLLTIEWFLCRSELQISEIWWNFCARKKKLYSLNNYSLRPNELF